MLDAHPISVHVSSPLELNTNLKSLDQSHTDKTSNLKYNSCEEYANSNIVPNEVRRMWKDAKKRLRGEVNSDPKSKKRLELFELFLAL